jgi:hypothetical protein
VWDWYLTHAGEDEVDAFTASEAIAALSAVITRYGPRG